MLVLDVKLDPDFISSYHSRRVETDSQAINNHHNWKSNNYDYYGNC